MFGGISKDILKERKNFMMEKDEIDLIECKPCEYRDTNHSCTRPLYLINQISFISTFKTKHDYDLTKLLKVYHWSSWITLAAMISILILLANNQNTFWKSFWSFIDPLFGKGNSLSIKCFSYALYLLALIPIIEIVKNEILASLMIFKELKFDTLDDFINPKVVVWMLDNPNYWRRECKKIN